MGSARTLKAQSEGGPRPPPNKALQELSEGNVKPLTEMAHACKPDGDYAMGKKLDAGSQGSVYLAKDRKQGTEVAVKHVQLQSNKPNSKELSLLTSEVAFLFACDHPNIVKLFTVYKNDRDVYLVMECMGGGKLTDIIEDPSTSFNEKQIAAILTEVLKGLAYLHRDGCMHRDIKSDNVLLNADGEVKLGDFGFVASVTKQMMNKRTTVVGTPYWMAPEVIQGEYDLKADIWSIGILMIELCDKEPPWMDLSPMQAMYKITHNPPPTLEKSKRKWSAECHDFLRLTVMKKPRDRPSADELLKHPFLVQHKGADTRFLKSMLKK